MTPLAQRVKSAPTTGIADAYISFTIALGLSAHRPTPFLDRQGEQTQEGLALMPRALPGARLTSYSL